MHTHSDRRPLAYTHQNKSNRWSTGFQLSLAAGVQLSLAAGPAGASGRLKLRADRHATGLTAQIQAKLQVKELPTVSPSATASEARQSIARMLDAGMYLQAMDEVQKLREKEPQQADNLVLLGDALLGLGQFHKAIGCYLQAARIQPEHPAILAPLSQLLAARADGLMVVSDLGARGDFSMSFLMDLEEAVEARMGDRATPLESQLDAPIQTRISDRLKVRWKVNGVTARLLFDTGASGMAISDDFAERAHMSASQAIHVQGIADTGATRAGLTTATLELGDVRLQDVPVMILPDLDRFSSASAFDGIVGPGTFPGFTYRLDRKHETLDLYPPGVPVPEAGPTAVTQPFYWLGNLMVTDVAVRNRTTGQGYAMKMLVDTGAQFTLFDVAQLQALDLGELQTTRSVTMAGATSYTKAVEVTFAELRLGHGTFAMEHFLAAPMGAGGWFTPYGYLGRDVLREFIITVDPIAQTMTFELYE